MNSQLSWKIVKQFSSRNAFGFTLQDVVREFPEKNRVYLARILIDMVDKGMLCKISRNNYLIIPGELRCVYIARSCPPLRGRLVRSERVGC